MIYLVLFYLIYLLKHVCCYGSHDELICKMSDASCSHQLHSSNANCMVEFINSTDCPIYSVAKTYHPYKLPFVLQTYRDKDINTVALNLTFPNPQFKSITFHYKNEWYPKYHLCRSFHIDQIGESQIRSSLFWDCLMFHVSVVEGNFFTIEITDDTGFGGIYSFRIPAADEQDQDIANYHTFFYLHKDYFDNMGRLLATLQGPPFSVVAYNVSILSCVSNSLSCADGILVASYIIHDSEFANTKYGRMKTIDLGRVDAPGRYAVSVQMISADCNGNCAISFSSIFELPSNKILQTIGIFAVLFFVAATGCLAVLMKLKSRHNKHVQETIANPISVLFVYHPHSFEMYKMLSMFKTFLHKECYTVPMLIDQMIGGQNPKQWTEQNMISASKVIFFLPTDLKVESATPIKMQYSYALNYFSGCNFSRKGDRFCYVRFVDSNQPSETLYGLNSFSFEKDLPAIISWIHGESFIHKILYWKKIAKKWPSYLQDGDSMMSNYSDLSDFNGMLDEFSNTDNLLLEDTPLKSVNDKSTIGAHFDRHIPDVQMAT